MCVYYVYKVSNEFSEVFSHDEFLFSALAQTLRHGPQHGPSFHKSRSRPSKACTRHCTRPFSSPTFCCSATQGAAEGIRTRFAQGLVSLVVHKAGLRHTRIFLSVGYSIYFVFWFCLFFHCVGADKCLANGSQEWLQLHRVFTSNLVYDYPDLSLNVHRRCWYYWKWKHYLNIFILKVCSFLKALSLQRV